MSEHSPDRSPGDEYCDLTNRRPVEQQTMFPGTINPERYVTCVFCEAHVPASRIVREGRYGPICDACGGRF